MKNLTLDQLYEVRAALWSRFETCRSEHSETVQTLTVGSEEMTKTITAWETQRDNINAALSAVNERIDELSAVARKSMRPRRA